MPQVVQVPTEVTGPFCLDPNILKQLDEMVVKPEITKVKKLDLDFLKEEINIPSFIKKRENTG